MFSYLEFNTTTKIFSDFFEKIKDLQRNFHVTIIYNNEIDVDYVISYLYNVSHNDKFIILEIRFYESMFDDWKNIKSNLTRVRNFDFRFNVFNRSKIIKSRNVINKENKMITPYGLLNKKEIEKIYKYITTQKSENIKILPQFYPDLNYSKISYSDKNLLFHIYKNCLFIDSFCYINTVNFFDSRMAIKVFQNGDCYIQNYSLYFSKQKLYIGNFYKDDIKANYKKVSDNLFNFDFRKRCLICKIYDLHFDYSSGICGTKNIETEISCFNRKLCSLLGIVTSCSYNKKEIIKFFSKENFEEDLFNDIYEDVLVFYSKFKQFIKKSPKYTKVIF